jgi:WD40 repeat protein
MPSLFSLNRCNPVKRSARFYPAWGLTLALLFPSISNAQQPREGQSRILTPVDEAAKPQSQTAGPASQTAERPQLVLQTGVTESVTKILFNHDDSLVAAMGMSGGAIKVWDSSTGRELLALKPKDGGVSYFQTGADFTFSSDGKSILTFAGGLVRQFEILTGKLARESSLFDGRESGWAQFSADGKLLATFNQETSLLRIWDVAAGALLQSKSYQLKPDSKDFKLVHLNAVAFSPDGRSIAISEDIQEMMSIGASITLYDLASWKPQRTITLQAAVSQKEQQKAMQKSSRDALDAMMKGKSGQAITPGMGDQTHTIFNRTLRFTSDGRTLALLKRDLRQNLAMKMDDMNHDQAVVLELYDVAGGRSAGSFNVSPEIRRKSMREFGGQSSGTLSIRPDGKQILAAGNDATVKLIDVSSGRVLTTLSSKGIEVLATSFSADGGKAATADIGGTIRLWNVARAGEGRAEETLTLNSPALGVGEARFSADGKSLVVASNNVLNVWELSAGTSTRTISLGGQNPRLAEDFTNHPYFVGLSRDGKLFFRNEKNTLKSYDVQTGAEVRSLTVEMSRSFGGLSMSSDGGRIAIIKETDKLSGVFDMLRGRGGDPNDSLDPNDPNGPADPNDPNAKDARKNAGKGRGGMFGGFGGIRMGRGGGDSREGKKVDTKEVMRINKEVQKKQQEYSKAMQDGEMAKAGKIMEEMQALIVQMTEASGQSGQALPFPSSQPAAPPAPDPQAAKNSTAATAPGQSSKDGVKVIEMGTGRELTTIPGQGLMAAIPHTNALSPNGRLLATSFSAYKIALTDVDSGREVMTLTVDRAFMTQGLTFSPDGRYFAALNSEARPGVNQNQSNISLSQRYINTLRIWDISDPAKGARSLPPITVSGQFPIIAFSRDGRQVGVGSNEVTFYDVATGRETLKLMGHTMPVASIDFSPDGNLIVTGSEDGSARLWRAQTGEPVATLVHLNGGADWLVVTPDGLFDGTPGAWNQIMWRFTQNIFDVTPVEVYFGEFFYPGLLADLYAGKSPRASKDVTQKDRRQPVVSLTAAQGSAANVGTRTIKLNLEVSEPKNGSGAGARDLRLFRNGTLVKVWRGDLLKGQARTQLEATVPIVAGENRLTAYAFNRDNVKSSDAILSVTGADSLRRKGTAYVIAAGVNQYANAQYNLKYAVADASSFAEEVRAQQGKLQQFERVEIIPLLDREATKANLLLAFKRLAGGDLPANAPAALKQLAPSQPEDAVLLYFAGHGVAQGQRFFLVPHDLGYTGARNALTQSAVQSILQHSISDLELEAALEGVDAGQLLFVLDACNSGQALEAEEKRRGPMNSPGLAQLAYEKGMYILTAAQSYQVALEAAQLGHGYLTYALVEEGLKKGLADRDAKDGQVLAREWFNFATERVPQMQEKNLGARILLEEQKVSDPATTRSVQRPRVFYRRETEARPLVVAKP